MYQTNITILSEKPIKGLAEVINVLNGIRMGAESEASVSIEESSEFKKEFHIQE